MYEVIFHYFEAAEKGKYNEDDPKTKKITVGKIDDPEVSLDTVAGKIISQFARRNILVTDVEIYEYTKKRLAFKEEEDGIKIKNRKYSFDDGAHITTLEETQEEDAAQKITALLAANPNILAQLQSHTQPHQKLPQPHQNIVKKPQKNPLRFEIFDPTDASALLPIAKSKGWVFTVGKQYPIYEEKIAADLKDGVLYTTIDDSGKQRIVSDKFFIPISRPLSGSFAEDLMEQTVIGAPKPGAREPQLSWDGMIETDVPNLRGR